MLYVWCTLNCSEILIFQSVVRAMESLVAGLLSGNRKKLCTSVVPDYQMIRVGMEGAVQKG